MGDGLKKCLVMNENKYSNISYIWQKRNKALPIYYFCIFLFICIHCYYKLYQLYQRDGIFCSSWMEKSSSFLLLKTGEIKKEGPEGLKLAGKRVSVSFCMFFWD